jgi:hypothetical protein
MAERHLPVRPNLDQLKHQAKDLLRALRSNDDEALVALDQHHPQKPSAASAKLADAQLVLARQYGLPSWRRLVLACKLTDAIWRDDVTAVGELIRSHPHLITEDARGVVGNWGPPMSYAANLGRDQIIDLLHGLGATDIQFAFDRACLQGRLDSARRLYDLGARPQPGAIMGPCETHNAEGLAFLFELGAAISDEQGDPLAPIALVLQTYCRNPKGKHRCLDLLAQQGAVLPDTPTMAVHRGRMDLLQAHLIRDPHLVSRRFTHEDIYPPSVGCHADHSLALHGTPLAGGTLLHLCVDMDEWDIATWLLANGADADARATIDAEGFGGHNALFGCVVSQPYRVGLRKDDAFARLLLEHGADPQARASLRKQLRFVDDETMHEYHHVNVSEWGHRFHDQDWVNRAALTTIEAASEA